MLFIGMTKQSSVGRLLRSQKSLARNDFDLRDMSKKEKQFLNLWELKPKRNAEWETTDEGKVVVLVPKFRNPFLVKWLMPHLSKPYFRIKLDDVGAMIWQQSDGATTVASISESLKKKFGQTVEPVDARINHFLNHLERGDLIIFENTQA